ncbi:unnamed protein product [Macrosiphum euphorbiae]|uniref:Secreted protein n=1 Tax=Macrosiphum euphorbiae TaxID=13131 RepID=A0AAV0W6N2_9HEMI|nr:unnamed protein product [Macrosiphum euphorbiae]
MLWPVLAQVLEVGGVYLCGLPLPDRRCRARVLRMRPMVEGATGTRGRTGGGYESGDHNQQNAEEAQQLRSGEEICGTRAVHEGTRRKGKTTQRN